MIAYPVGPPNERPIDATITPTSTGPNPFASSEPGTKLPGEITARSANTSMNPPMTSAMRFAPDLRIAGAVENTASFASGSGVAAQCGKYVNHTKTPPIKPPAIWATM